MKLNMKMTKCSLAVCSVISIVAGATACSVDAVEGVDFAEAQEALTGPTGTGFFGSDTMFDAITAAIAHSGVTGLTYLGTGSGNGEKCLRGAAGAGVTYGGVTYCDGVKGQTIAPMSRNLNSCQSGEVSHRVALDAVSLWTSGSQGLADVASSKVHDAFCGTAGNGTGCTVLTWQDLAATGTSNPTNNIVLYRRDDASGTTDTFKSLNSCTAFCPNVLAVTDDSVAGPRLTTDAAGTSSLAGAGLTCATTDSATDCIGKLAASNVDVLGYAGLAADHLAPTAKALSVDGLAPTEDNIRNLISNPTAAYKYSRFLFLNENPTGPRTVAETNFLRWAFGRTNAATALTFETDLVNAGFLSCTTGTGHTALACGATACP